MERQDFKEIAHSGGKVTFNIHCDAQGHISIQMGYSHSSPTPMSLCAIYAHPDGFACGNVQLGGIGQPFNSPPYPNCITVFMASDSQGRFGHECPECGNHFRSANIPSKYLMTCPYCGLRAESYHYLTPPQASYLKHYIDTLNSGIAAIEANSENEIIIDMNLIADQVIGEIKPDFFYTSITQQTEFTCPKCDGYNDIRGLYGYCSSCGWRNNATALKAELDLIRDKLNTQKISLEEAVKLSVSAFDSAARDFTAQLIKTIPMLQSRQNELEQLLFHNLDKFHKLLNLFFGINLLHRMDAAHDFVKKMFLRRHVYEHDACVATKRYVDESGDGQIEEGMLIREIPQNVHQLIGCLNRMFSNYESGFHELLPPEPFCIDLKNNMNQTRT
jgi:ribosomal protein L37AE/L43A